jgi:uncharacterized protein YqjF (DUF2071 family)
MENPKDILKKTSHRNYPLPKRHWQQYQEWHGNVFMHWKIDARILTGLLPKGLLLDTVEGSAWISIVAFSVQKLHPRYVPPMAFYSDFHEVNVRTYVIRNGIPGIYFLSLEAQKKLPALMARMLMGLPYIRSDMSREGNAYRSHNPAMAYRLDFDYHSKGHLLKKTAIDVWLTERHALYLEKGNDIYRIDVHHKIWPLQNVILRPRTIRYPLITSVDQNNPNLVHFADRLAVLIWNRQKC